MGDKGFITKGSVEYFTEREKKIQTHIDEARAKIEEIETRVRGEIAAIAERRELLRHHLTGFLAARNDLVAHREKTAQLIDELQAVVGLCDIELPVLDNMLDELERDYSREDYALGEAESSRKKQLNKHERKKARYEGRQVRLGLRKSLLLRDQESVPPPPPPPPPEEIAIVGGSISVSDALRQSVEIAEKQPVIALSDVLDGESK